MLRKRMEGKERKAPRAEKGSAGECGPINDFPTRLDRRSDLIETPEVTEMGNPFHSHPRFLGILHSTPVGTGAMNDVLDWPLGYLHRERDNSDGRVDTDGMLRSCGDPTDVFP